MRRLSLNRSEPAKKSGQNIPKNRCRTTIPERMVETLAELPFIGDQVGLFRAQPGRPKRTAERTVTKPDRERHEQLAFGSGSKPQLVDPASHRANGSSHPHRAASTRPKDRGGNREVGSRQGIRIRPRPVRYVHGRGAEGARCRELKGC